MTPKSFDLLRALERAAEEMTHFCPKHKHDTLPWNARDEILLLRADLRLAAETLRHYESLHRAKNTADSTEKAEKNAKLAARFETTLND